MLTHFKKGARRVRKLLKILIAAMMSISVLAFGEAQEKSFNLFESPNNNSKIVATLATGTPIIPIIRQNGWVKIADPKTGNVGWVQSSKIDKSPVVITQIISGGSQYCQDNDCQFSFYSSRKPLTSHENDALWQRIQVQERYLLSQQATMQKQMNEFMNDLDQLMLRSTTIGNDIAENGNNDQHTKGTTLPFSEKQSQSQKSTKKPFWKFWEK